MPFSTAEGDGGARVIGADRATWVRLGVALALGAAAFGAPHIGGTAASFTDSSTTGGTITTCWDFSQPTKPCPPEPPQAPPPAPEPPATVNAPAMDATAVDAPAVGATATDG